MIVSFFFSLYFSYRHIKGFFSKFSKKNPILLVTDEKISTPPPPPPKKKDQANSVYG